MDADAGAGREGGGEAGAMATLAAAAASNTPSTISAQDSAETSLGTPASGASMKLVLDFAVAYAITKALLPARLLLSVSATPWLARRVVVPISGVFRRVVGRGVSVKGGKGREFGAAAGTGTLETGVLPVPKEAVKSGKGL